MTYSKHYTKERKNRDFIIENRGGDGAIIFDEILFDKRSRKNVRYQVTELGVLKVLRENEDFLITKYYGSARQISQLYQRVGENPPYWLMTIARQNENYS